MGFRLQLFAFATTMVMLQAASLYEQRNSLYNGLITENSLDVEIPETMLFDPDTQGVPKGKGKGKGKVAHPERIKAADNASESAKVAAKVAKSDMMKHEQDETKFETEAATLNKKQVDLRAKATAENLAAAQKMNDFVKDATAKSLAAEAKSEKAKDANEILQAKYKKQVADLHAADDADYAAAKARIDETEAGIAANEREISAQKAEMKALENAETAREGELARTQAGIQAAYDADSNAIAAKLKTDSDALTAETVAAKAKFAAKFKTNAEKAAAELATLKAEAKGNKKRDEEDKAALQAKYKAKEDAQEASHKSWKARADAEAAALSAEREGDKKACEAAAKAAELDYSTKMNEAAAKMQDAEAAQKKLDTQMEKDKKVEAAIHSRFQSSMAEDAEIKACASDGSECQNLDGSCHKATPTGPYLSNEDLVMCTDVKPTEQAYAGEAYVGLGPPLPKAPVEVETAECITAKKAFKEDCNLDYTTDNQLPLIALACDEFNPCGGDQEKLESFFHMASMCPKWCVPGSTTSTSDGVQDSDGECISRSTFAQVNQMIKDTPAYSDFGTAGRFPASTSTAPCKYAKALVKGFQSGLKVHAEVEAATSRRTGDIEHMKDNIYPESDPGATTSTTH